MIKVLGLGDNVVDKYMHIKPCIQVEMLLILQYWQGYPELKLDIWVYLEMMRQRNMFIKQFQIWELTFHTADSTMVRMAMQR